MKLQKPIRVIFVDDNSALIDGLAILAGRNSRIRVLGTANNGPQALEIIGKTIPDLVILDCQLPGMDGIEIARRIRKSGTPTKILVLSAYDDEYYILEMLKENISGYILKDEGPEILISAIFKVVGNEKFFSKTVMDKIIINRWQYG